MFLDPYVTFTAQGAQISAAQASAFAKEICADFNPIHDPDAKRFCVPGDLLFSLVLCRYGVSPSMRFRFIGMVGDNVPLLLPDDVADEGVFNLCDAQGRVLLEVERSGEVSRDPVLIESLIRRYVAFSGQNFPDLLMPLMAEHQVMFNPARPLVMYDSMSFSLDTLALSELELALKETSLLVEAKRADELIHFQFISNGRVVGQGVKKAVLGGLKPYEHEPIAAFAQEYEARRSQFNVVAPEIA